MLTLNQEIEVFKNFALKHLGVNSFYFGDEWETDSSITPVYPMFNAILQNVNYNKGQVSRTFLCVFSDLVNKDESNENHVLSDIEQICFDLPNYLRAVSNSGLLGTFRVSDDITLTDFTERNDDEVSGFFFEITLISNIGNNSCNLPINSGNVLDNNYLYVGGTVNAGNFEVLIKDQDGNTIQTFTTSGQYVVTILSGIQQVIGNTSTTVTQNIIN